MKRLMAGTLAAAASLALTASAQATPQTFYFGCPGTDRVSTGGDAGAWTATAPDTNFADGGGCAMASYWPSPASDAALSVANFGGKYSGDIKRVEFTLYDARVDGAAMGQRQIFAHLLVDGQDVTGEQALAAPMTPSADGHTNKSTFTIDDLNIPETTAARSIVLQVSVHYFANDYTTWLLGAKDYPASVTFSSHLDLPDDTGDDGE